jgi:hypothetical protein
MRKLLVAGHCHESFDGVRMPEDIQASELELCDMNGLIRNQ